MAFRLVPHIIQQLGVCILKKVYKKQRTTVSLYHYSTRKGNRIAAINGSTLGVVRGLQAENSLPRKVTLLRQRKH